MNYRLLYFFSTFIIVWGICGCKSKPTEPVIAPTVSAIPAETQQLLDDYERRFKERFEQANIPGAVVTIVHQGEIYTKGFGVRKMGAAEKIDKQTIFRLGSLSKGFAGTLSSLLVQEGTLDWQEKVKNILPDFQLQDSAQSERITIKHILSHSTGLQRHAYTDLVEAGVDLDQIFPKFSTLDLISEEGKIYAYANAPFALIEKVMATKTAKTFPYLLRQKLLGPLGMRRTFTDIEKFKADQNIALPHFYSSKHKGFRARRINEKYDNAISAGGIHASGEDMGLWLNLLLGHHPDILSEEALAELFSPVVPTRSNRYYDRWSEHPAQYALGWRVIELETGKIMHHGGYVNNYRSEIALDPANDLGICVIFNAFTPEANLVVPDFLKSAESLRKRNVEEAVESSVELVQ